MRVYIAGGFHDDPLCRYRLVDWLGQLVQELGNPIFIAVEMDPNIQAFLRARRGMFERLAGGLWGDGVAPDVGRVLAQAMAWEVDAHRAVVDADPIFLDERGSREATVEPKLHFGLMIEHLEGFNGERQSAEQVACHVSDRAIATAERLALNRYRNDQEFRHSEAERERGWLRRIRHELRMDGWGLVVVGALHASQYGDRTFRSLLAATPGVELGDVKYLGWSPPADIM